MTNQDYYNDPTALGQGMYISLKEIVEAYMDKLTPNDHTYDIDKRIVVKQARRAIRDLNFSAVRDYETIELSLSPSLQVMLPPDFVDYYKISWIDEFGTTYPIVQNARLNVSDAISQDNEYNYQYDGAGKLLIVSGTSPTADQEFPKSASGFNTDRSMIFENGYFKIDKKNGVIKFSSDAKEKTILLEYVTDGLSGKADSDIKILKLATDAVDEFIYFNLIARDVQVIATEKRRARISLNIAKRKLMSMINPVREEDIYQLLRAASRWVKQV